MSVEVYGGGGGASLKLQSKIVTPSTAQQIVTPDSGMDGLSKVTVDAMPVGTLAAPAISAGGLITSKIEKGGYLNAGDNRTLQLPTRSDQTIFPSTADQVAVPKGVFTTGQISVIGDANLIPANIRNGVNIFGVVGNFQGASLQAASWGPVSSGFVDIFIPSTTKIAALNVMFGGNASGLQLAGTFMGAMLTSGGTGTLTLGGPNGVYNCPFTAYEDHITADLSALHYGAFTESSYRYQGSYAVI